ncbi:hypothetical protein MDAP_001553 [Mitosporidium daphniae]
MSDKHNINLQHDENYEIRTANNLTIKPFLEENFSPIEFIRTVFSGPNQENVEFSHPDSLLEEIEQLQELINLKRSYIIRSNIDTFLQLSKKLDQWSKKI